MRPTYLVRAREIPAAAFVQGDGRVEERTEIGGGQDRPLVSRASDATLLQQHHLLDLRNDVLDMVRDEDNGRARPGNDAHLLEKPLTRDEVQAGRRLVQHQRLRR